MHCQTTTHTTPSGWSQPLPRHLDGAQTLVLAFGASDLVDAPQPLAELAAAFPNSVVMGCSTSGEIAGPFVQDQSISVAVAQFEHTRLKRACTTIDNAADSHAAGARLAAQLNGEGLRSVFILSDGMHVNGTPLVAGLAEGLPPGVQITGGLAGDGSRFARTWVLGDPEPKAQQLCAVGFYGERLRVGHGCVGGWLDFGPERRITKAEGNVLYELDGKPALQLYKTYLGDMAKDLPGAALLFPLAVRRSAGDGESVVRTILGIDEATQSMTFAGDMPQGGIARLMRATNDQLIDSAGQAGRAALGMIQADSPALVVSVSCVGRRLVLGQRTDEEVEIVLEDAPAGSAHVGFYSYGEISPSVAGGACELHNQTMTVTVFSES